MQSITRIYGCKQLNAKNVVITNELGTKADILAVVKRDASAKVIKLTSAPIAELELAA